MVPTTQLSSLLMMLFAFLCFLSSSLQAEVFCEIGELVNQSRVLPRDHGKKFLLFKSLGMEHYQSNQ